MKRVWKYFQPDGTDIDGPYWVLPNDRTTHDFSEWLREDESYWRAVEEFEKKRDEHL